MMMMNNFYLLLPLLGGIGVALVAGPLGAVMVWRRLAYFGDTLAHSGLLGITLALALSMDITVGVCIVSVIVALLLLRLQTRVQVASDTLLGILSHTTLAIGLLALAFLEEVRVDVLGFLYGDILTITLNEVGIIYFGGFLVLVIFAYIWQPLLRIIAHAELAQVEGVPIAKIQTVYTLLLAIIVAIAIKIVGVLLITALLIIPAASARAVAKSPEQMACFASIIGIIAVVIGMGVSHFWDVPTGPAIVVVAAMALILNYKSIN